MSFRHLPTSVRGRGFCGRSAVGRARPAMAGCCPSDPTLVPPWLPSSRLISFPSATHPPCRPAFSAQLLVPASSQEQATATTPSIGSKGLSDLLHPRAGTNTRVRRLLEAAEPAMAEPARGGASAPPGGGPNLCPRPAADAATAPGLDTTANAPDTAPATAIHTATDAATATATETATATAADTATAAETAKADGPGEQGNPDPDPLAGSAGGEGLLVQCQQQIQRQG